MARFTATGLELNAHRDLSLFPWRANDVNLRDGQGRQDTVNAWLNELDTFGYNNGGADICDIDGADLDEIDGDLIIFGHGNAGDRIAKDTGYSLSPRTLARLLKAKELPDDFAGNIILWSCQAGVAGGAAQSLSIALKNHGYMLARVWGCRFNTGGIVNKAFTCYPNYVDNANRGALSYVLPQHMASY